MLRNLFCIFVAAAWITVLFPFACLAMLVTLDPGASIWLARRLWSPVLLWAGGARLVVEGREHVDPFRPTIYVSNHQSTIDIPVLFVAIPANVRFVAKKQLGWVPVLGWYLQLAGFPLIDRTSRARAIATLQKAGRTIHSGVSIIVFPEGTRSEDGRILPFKKGSFALALEAQVPICPVTIEGSGRLMPKNSWNITPGEIRVRIGAPMDTTAYAAHERERLMRNVRNEIIRQDLELGGKGGDVDDAIAEAGLEGVGQKRAAAGGGRRS